VSIYSVDKLISQARKLAADYRKATGKPLPGVSIEIAEHDAATHLGLELCPHPRPGGYDAIGTGDREGKRIQIKGRAIFDEKKSGQRIGQMKTDQEWDSVVLVIMDEDYDAVEIYETERDAILEALEEAGSSKRNRRGAMSVARFKNIGRLVWTRENGLEGEVWDNKASV
jgi:hypothetical protein